MQRAATNRDAVGCCNPGGDIYGKPIRLLPEDWPNVSTAIRKAQLTPRVSVIHRVTSATRWCRGVAFQASWTDGRPCYPPAAKSRAANGRTAVNRAETIPVTHSSDTQRPTREPATGRITRVSTRARAVRLAFVAMAVSASVGLAGCAAIEELRQTFLRWVESERLPTEPGVIADELPEAATTVPPEKTPKPIKRRPQPKDSARRTERPRTATLPPKKPPTMDSTEPVRPEGTQGQSAPPSRSTPRWLGRWPEAPPADRFSH
jgi:hypothetical protein